MGAIVLPGQFGQTYNSDLTSSVNQSTDTLGNVSRLLLAAKQAKDNHQQALADLQGTVLKNQMGAAQYDEYMSQSANRASAADTAVQQGQATLQGTTLGNAGKMIANDQAGINLQGAANELAETWAPDNVKLRAIDNQARVAKAQQAVQQGVAQIGETNARAEQMRQQTAALKWQMDPSNPINVSQHLQIANQFFKSRPEMLYAARTPKGMAQLKTMATSFGIDPSTVDLAVQGQEQMLSDERQAKIADDQAKRRADPIQMTEQALGQGIQTGSARQAYAAAQLRARQELTKGSNIPEMDSPEVDSLAHQILNSQGVGVDIVQGLPNALIDLRTGQRIPPGGIQSPSPATRPSSPAPVAPQAQPQPAAQGGAPVQGNAPGPGQALVQDPSGRKFIIDKATQKVIRQVP